MERKTRRMGQLCLVFGLAAVLQTVLVCLFFRPGKCSTVLMCLAMFLWWLAFLSQFTAWLRQRRKEKHKEEKPE